jgi:hypothetical protein
MDCKFKQINLNDTNSSTCDNFYHNKSTSEIVNSNRTAKHAINTLLDNVAQHIYHQRALEKSK